MKWILPVFIACAALACGVVIGKRSGAQSAAQSAAKVAPVAPVVLTVTNTVEVDALRARVRVLEHSHELLVQSLTARTPKSLKGLLDTKRRGTNTHPYTEEQLLDALKRKGVDVTAL